MADLQKYQADMEKQKAELDKDAIVNVPAFRESDVQPVAFEEKQYKAESKPAELARKAVDYAQVAQRDLKGTLDRIFDMYESPNFYQIVWVLAFLLTVGIFVLSTIVTIKGGNTIVSALSAAATTLLFVGLIGYVVYRPKSFSFSSLTGPKVAETKKYEGAVDTEAATRALFAQDE